MNNPAGSAYVHYSTKLPNRKALESAMAATKVVLVCSIAAILWNIFCFATKRYNDFMVWQGSDCPSGDLYFDKYGVYTCTNTNGLAPLTWSYHHWYVAVIVLVVTLVITVISNNIFDKHYCDVKQGKIIGKDTSGGGRYSLAWMLLIEGYTEANELCRQWKCVTHGLYEQKKIGDFVDLR